MDGLLICERTAIIWVEYTMMLRTGVGGRRGKNGVDWRGWRATLLDVTGDWVWRARGADCARSAGRLEIAATTPDRRRHQREKE